MCRNTRVRRARVSRRLIGNWRCVLIAVLLIAPHSLPPSFASESFDTCASPAQDDALGSDATACSAPPSNGADQDSSPTSVEDVDDASLSSLVGAQHTLVAFIAPWCGHCKRVRKLVCARRRMHCARCTALTQFYTTAIGSFTRSTNAQRRCYQISLCTSPG